MAVFFCRSYILVPTVTVERAVCTLCVQIRNAERYSIAFPRGAWEREKITYQKIVITEGLIGNPDVKTLIPDGSTRG